MDVMSNVFKDDLLVVLLPHLKEQLNSSEWVIIESAILALGAVAEGCIKGIQPHLPELVPFPTTQTPVSYTHLTLPTKA